MTRGRGPAPTGWARLGTAAALLAGGVWAASALAVPGLDDPTGWSVPYGSTTTATDDAASPTAPDPGPATTAPDVAAGTGAPALLPPAFVTSAALACAGGPAPSVVGGAAAPATLAGTPAPWGAGTGTAVLDPGARTLGRPGGAATAGETAATVAQIDLPVGPAAVLRGSGTLAPALAATTTLLSAAEGQRGLSVTPCVLPVEEQWLVAGGEGAGRTVDVVLINPGERAVQARIEVLGTTGATGPVGTAEVAVPAGGRVVQRVQALAPQATAPAVHVRAVEGTVAAHLVEEYREGPVEHGLEVVAPVAAPAADLLVPVTAGPDDPGVLTSRVLRLVNPGPEAAVVQLSGLAEDGARDLAEPVATVPAGATLDVPLTDLPTGLQALRLRADAPVTAALGTRSDPRDTTPRQGWGPWAGSVVRPAGDLAWTGAAAATTDPLGVVLPPATGDVPLRRLRLAAAEATTATVTWVDGSGGSSTMQVPLGYDATVAVDVPVSARSVWVRPSSPPGLVASLELVGRTKRGPLLSAPTLPPVPWGRDVVTSRVSAP